MSQLLRYAKLDPEADDLVYAHAGDSGVDLSVLSYSYTSDLKKRFDLQTDVLLRMIPGDRFIFWTGIRLFLEPGTEAQVRTRSGLALKNGIVVVNSPGTIDSGYEGEIGVIISNTGSAAFNVEYKQKLAQLVIAPVLICEPKQVSGDYNAEASSRADGGFGSTGV